jgi:hypothetical protein
MQHSLTTDTWLVLSASSNFIWQSSLVRIKMSVVVVAIVFADNGFCSAAESHCRLWTLNRIKVEECSTKYVKLIELFVKSPN